MTYLEAIANIFNPVVSSQERITNHERLYYQESTGRHRSLRSISHVRASERLLLN
ncbi:hypothetical protein H6H03_25605 [Nostoc paludosum FACHB-159]|uniref:Uncharacterized protein n=1 Tax=Nostoc paludosum FACHB-159 TaxID=2692908 RepID=A0ABR8KCG9_9NOSO|nr:hypothetical protein [Nostoc paludosum FACHB-159]